MNFDPARPGVVYALVDPRTQAVRYIGATQQQPPEMRLKQHATSSTSGCSTWIDELLAQGLRPEFRILERVDGARLGEREWALIHQHDKAGAFLLNTAANWNRGCDNPDRIERAKQFGRTVYYGAISDYIRWHDSRLCESRDEDERARHRAQIRHWKAVLSACNEENWATAEPDLWTVTVTWTAHSHNDFAEEHITHALQAYGSGAAEVTSGVWHATLTIEAGHEQYALARGEEWTLNAARRAGGQCCIEDVQVAATLRPVSAAA